jgi:hypothetical protein
MSDRVPPLPAFLRVLDGLTIVAALIAVTVFITGGFREWTPIGRVSMTSWLRPIVIALAATCLRHWLRPSPTIARRVWDGLRRRSTMPEVRAALPVAISTRTGVFVVGFLAIVLFGYRPDVPVPWRAFDNEILNLPARWDTGWYLGVAIDGYSWRPAGVAEQQNIAFFPAYPMLIRYGSLLLGREALWTGVLVSWVSFFGALVYLFRLTRARFGDEAASAAIALTACYPYALFFSTAYTEALFLLAIVAACHHFEREEWWRSGLWGLVAGLSRPNGCLLSVVLGCMALAPLWPRDGGRGLPALPRAADWPRLADRLATAAMPGIGMLMYSTYIYFLTGNPFQWAAQNAAWGRVYRGIASLVSQQAQTIGDHGLYTYAATWTVDALQLCAVIIMLASVWPVYRRLGVPYAVMILVNLLPPLMMGGLLSTGRVTSVLFPTFIWLGIAVPATHRSAWLASFAMLQAMCAAMFFTWRPLY